MKDKKDYKRMIFYIEEDVFARFLAALRYDGLRGPEFINRAMAGYIDRNPHIRSFVEEITLEKQSARVKRNKQRDYEDEAYITSHFGLDENDIEDIFDIIESEKKDL